jgi:N6-adenosine-specific RNA methylase IME4
MLEIRPYRCVVADPPWQPAMAITNGGAPKASPQRHYDTLSLSQIIELRPRLADQAHLYIWCLSQHVDWGYEVARAWGAEPIILLTWKKPGLGAGRFRCNTEHVLLSRVGSRHGNPFGSGGRHQQATEGTCFEWPRGRHSEKPREFFDLVERLSPEPRLEMYARAPRHGWAVWGNQADGEPDSHEPSLFELASAKDRSR